MLAPLKSSYLLDGYAQQVAGRLGIDVEVTKEKIRSTPVEGEETGNAPADDYGYEYAPSGGYGEAYAPADDYGYDYVPEPEPMVQPQPSVSLGALSAEDRTQIRAERNLLAMMADNIDLFRGYADRIATFAWADSRHEAIAWSMLATPVGTTPADVVAAAPRACPDAPKILSASSFSSTSAWDTQTNVEFVVNEAEIRSIDRRVSMLTASLAGGADPARSREALQELGQLRARRGELRASQPLE